MTAPGYDTPYTPSWLDIGDVKAYLRLPDDDPTDDDLLSNVAAATEPVVERAQPSYWVSEADGTRTYEPDPSTYQGAVMYAARLYRRRNSPAGVETLSESMAYVARWDPDIERLLRTGAFRVPRVG